MTTQGEPDQTAADRTAAGQDGETPAAPSRLGPGRRRTALWCALVVAAAGIGWVVSRPNPGDLIPGLGSTSGQTKKSQPAPGLASEQPLTEAQAFTADHYFPGQRAVDQNGVQAHRTAAREGTNCTEILLAPDKDPLKDTGCQAYLSVAFTNADQQVVSSVTILRFADEKSAQKARQALADPAALAFLTAESPAPTPSPTPSPAATGSPSAAVSGAPSSPAGTTPPPTATTPPPKPAGVARVEPVGHYLTVTVSRYTDQRTTLAPGDQTLDKAARVLSYTARAPFLWM
ncbi:hypothetical protein [Kitasatospora sp. DSM 101779]|uniref:hypothetical protein n=1 Tax=Kitasatospora sp. DSM 101779 TaxID=2853165 RepID=UPI0021D83B6E|nr:hypothetical protein [Kitasatospora sp. DSM 101779]MCU7821099.1 hypothetical protein [Kitasatospora sp. DSM 101779]